MEQTKQFWMEACRAADDQPLPQLQRASFVANGIAVRAAHNPSHSVFYPLILIADSSLRNIRFHRRLRVGAAAAAAAVASPRLGHRRGQDMETHGQIQVGGQVAWALKLRC
jgi:hypothetical protein